MGLYSKAEALYLENKSVVEKTLGKNHPKYALVLNNLAALYAKMGAYPKVKYLYLESKKIREKTLGKSHPEYATSLNSLAHLYINQGAYQKAAPLYLESKNIMEKTLGKNHPEYAIALNNLAGVYQYMEAYPKAKALYLESKNVIEKTLGKHHPEYAVSLGNLASVYFKAKAYQKAEALYLESKSVVEKTLGKHHPEYAFALNNLANLYQYQRAYKKAVPLYLESIDAKLKELKNNQIILSEKGQKNYLKVNQFYFNHFKGFFIYIVTQEKTSLSEKGKLASKLLDLELVLKGWLLNGKQWLLQLIAQKAATDTTLARTYDQYLSLKAQTAKSINLSLEEKEKRKIDIERNIEQIEALEKQLYKKIGVELNSQIKYDFPSLRQALHDKEAAIEIMKQGTKYLALITTARQAYPQAILLDAKTLEAQIKTYQRAILSKAEDKTSYGKFWEEIGKYLQKQGIQKVYISPDGVYNQLNLNTLFNPVTGKYVEEEVDIQMLTTLREVIDAQKQKQRNTTSNLATLFGRPSYELPLANLQKEEKILKAAQPQGGNPSDFHFPPTSDKLLKQGKKGLRSGWADLPGTEAEIKAIAAVLGSQRQLKVSTHLGNEALELAVKQVAHPKILHIATHGFFIENFKAPTKVQKEDVVFDNFSRGGKAPSAAQVAKIAREEPMLRSGIVLAGASTYEKAKSKPDIEDGILTAYEASQMDLQGTELVVLSACETGLGEVENGEGVQGLQRAFIVAGAQSVILSLWKVDDNATKLLMNHFYKAWIGDKKSKRAAFRAAQAYLRNYEKNGKKIYAAPYYWGAFVMVGGE
ncbi:tetratricopeptide repeat domain protein [Microscilla marina ATCC 23134]|uniref:Tetratricopeptide repeat domain protein n=2 Tax=Microscilla marina TaxID=1027 RepID=A1ZHD4_MICM2|nr:tetratricopeptide repeat domain protein [Microscilla marina ATCC 23134]